MVNIFTTILNNNNANTSNIPATTSSITSLTNMSPICSSTTTITASNANANANTVLTSTTTTTTTTLNDDGKANTKIISTDAISSSISTSNNKGSNANTNKHGDQTSANTNPYSTSSCTNKFSSKNGSNSNNLALVIKRKQQAALIQQQKHLTQSDIVATAHTNGQTHDLASSVLSSKKTETKIRSSSSSSSTSSSVSSSYSSVSSSPNSSQISFQPLDKQHAHKHLTAIITSLTSADSSKNSGGVTSMSQTMVPPVSSANLHLNKILALKNSIAANHIGPNSSLLTSATVTAINNSMVFKSSIRAKKVDLLELCFVFCFFFVISFCCLSLFFNVVIF